jgi:hypothetical protein
MAKPAKSERHLTQRENLGRSGKKQLTAWIDAEQHAALSLLVQDRGTTIPNYIQELVRSILLANKRLVEEEHAGAAPDIPKKTLVLLHAGNDFYADLDILDKKVREAGGYRWDWYCMEGQHTRSQAHSSVRPQIRYSECHDEGIQALARDKWVYSNWKFRVLGDSEEEEND